MKNYLLILPATITLAGTVSAQQNFNAPQLLNPAMTGFTPADVRASFNLGTDIPWATSHRAAVGVFAADAPILKGKLPKGDAVGIGISAASSSFSFGDNYSTSSKGIGLAAAYHKAIGKKKDQYISVGARGSMYEWQNTYLSGTVYGYSAGAMYTRPLTTGVTFYGGYAMNGTVNSTALTHTLYVGGVWNINRRFTLNATVLSAFAPPMQGGPVRDLGFTTMAGYTLNPGAKWSTKVYLGGSVYGRGSVTPYVGIEKWGFRLAVSPHINTGSGLRPVTAGDISLMWIGNFKKHKKDTRSFPRIY